MNDDSVYTSAHATKHECYPIVLCSNLLKKFQQSCS